MGQMMHYKGEYFEGGNKFCENCCFDIGKNTRCLSGNAENLNWDCRCPLYKSKKLYFIINILLFPFKIVIYLIIKIKKELTNGTENKD